MSRAQRLQRTAHRGGCRIRWTRGIIREPSSGLIRVTTQRLRANVACKLHRFLILVQDNNIMLTRKPRIMLTSCLPPPAHSLCKPPPSTPSMPDGKARPSNHHLNARPDIDLPTYSLMNLKALRHRQTCYHPILLQAIRRPKLQQCKMRLSLSLSL